MEQEDRAYERWKGLAAVQTAKLAAMRTVADTEGQEREETLDALTEHVTKD